MQKLDPNKQYAFEGVVKEVMNSYEAPGMAVSIITPEGCLYRNFFGYRDVENQLPINQDTIFGLASITKSFTCLSIMQLAEKGVIQIEQPVSRYLPEFKDDTVTVAHLMTHSGGYFPLPRIKVDEVAKELGIFEDKDGDLAYSEQLALKGTQLVAERLNQQTKRIGKAGEFMSYCNDGYGLLSEIIHRHGGEDSYGEYLNKHILAPLGMTRSSTEFISVAKDPNATNLHIHRNGKLSTEKNFYDNAFVLMGGGAMKSTIRDMEQYLRMYLTGGMNGEGESIIGENSILEMGKPRQYYRHQQYYGYGLSTNHIGAITTIGHGGSLTGVSTQFIWSPELKVGVIVLCNTSGVPTSMVADSAMRWVAGYEPTLTTTPMPPRPWDSKTIAEATGRYISGEGSIIDISRDGDGISVALNGETFPTVMVLPTIAHVKIKMTNGELRLFQDKNGKVWGVGYGGRIIPRA